MSDPQQSAPLSARTHGKRRAYAAAQYLMAAGSPAQPPAAPGAPGSYFSPAAGGAAPAAPGYGVDQAAQGIAGMGLNGLQGYAQPAYNQPGATPAYGAGAPAAPAYGGSPTIPAYGGAAPAGGAGYGYGNGQQAAPPQQLNTLHPTDLMLELPAPILDLRLPPPPLLPPADALVTGSEDLNESGGRFRCTMNVMPKLHTVLKKTKLPLAVVVRPYTHLRNEDEPVAVVSDLVISRCRRCRSYINPFVTIVEQGRRWRCNMCNLQNDVPSGFDFNEHTRESVDRFQRSELRHSVVEFVAPPEYMVRAPQPVVMVFVIDISVAAVQLGLTATVANTILELLDRIPDPNELAKVAFIGVDSALHFFEIPAEGEPLELVVPDVDEPFLPQPESLLVNLKQHRAGIDSLLSRFALLFGDTTNPGFALGPALRLAHKMVLLIGGKIEVFAATLPNVGPAALSVRDEEAAAQKGNESKALLLAADSFYKSFAIECNQAQITVDMFLALLLYQDVATLANLPRFTAGQTHFYAGWLAARVEDVQKFQREVLEHLLMDITLEAVLRVRGLTGIRMLLFYGNFFNRSSDLCSFPTFPRDQLYVIEMQLEDTLTQRFALVQAALLHTTDYGERRIRVMTMAIPILDDVRAVYASTDQLAIAAYYTHKAVEKALLLLLNDARQLLTNKATEILLVFRKEVAPNNMGGLLPLQVSTNLRMLPLLLFALTKHLGLRNGRVPLDHRAAALNLLLLLPLPELVQYIYPTVYSLHDMADECGLADENGNVVLPEPRNASLETLERYGLYLILNLQEMFLWVGGDAVPELAGDVFGVNSVFEIPVGKTELPATGSQFNERLRTIIHAVRQNKLQVTYQSLYVVRGPLPLEPVASANKDIMALRLWCLSELVEDRNNGGNLYREFLGQLREVTSK